jgi:hypothetical protein
MGSNPVPERFTFNFYFKEGTVAKVNEKNDFQEDINLYRRVNCLSPAVFGQYQYNTSKQATILFTCHICCYCNFANWYIKIKGNMSKTAVPV